MFKFILLRIPKGFLIKDYLGVGKKNNIIDKVESDSDESLK